MQLGVHPSKKRAVQDFLTNRQHVTNWYLRMGGPTLRCFSGVHLVLRPFVSTTHRRTSLLLEPRRTEGIIHTSPFYLAFQTTKVEFHLARLQCQYLAQRIQTHGGLNHSSATGESTIVLPLRSLNMCPFVWPTMCRQSGRNKQQTTTIVLPCRVVPKNI